MNIASVQSHVQRLVAQWKIAPSVGVVATPSDLPVTAPSDARAVYLPFKREAHLVADAHLSSAVAATIAHEVIAHHGTRELLGRRAWRSLMVAVQAGADARDERLLAVRDHVRYVYRDDAGAQYLSRTYEADELIAAVGEALIDHQSGKMRGRAPFYSLLRAARGHMRREVFLLNDVADYDQVEGILLAAEHRLRHGGLFWGLARRWYCSGMQKPMGAKNPPTSLAESERLLDRSTDWSEGWRESWMAVQLILTVLGAIGVGGLLLYGLLQILGVLPR